MHAALSFVEMLSVHLFKIANYCLNLKCVFHEIRISMKLLKNLKKLFEQFSGNYQAEYKSVLNLGCNQQFQ